MLRTASKFAGIGISAAMLILSSSANAEFNKGTHLGTGGQAKVNRVMSHGYQMAGAAEMQKNQTQVNIGSKRGGGCNMNVGSQNPGDKNAKEVIVTSKEIINICK